MPPTAILAEAKHLISQQFQPGKSVLYLSDINLVQGVRDTRHLIGFSSCRPHDRGLPEGHSGIHHLPPAKFAHIIGMPHPFDPNRIIRVFPGLFLRGKDHRRKYIAY